MPDGINEDIRGLRSHDGERVEAAIRSIAMRLEWNSRTAAGRTRLWAEHYNEFFHAREIPIAAMASQQRRMVAALQNAFRRTSHPGTLWALSKAQPDLARKSLLALANEVLKRTDPEAIDQFVYAIDSVVGVDARSITESIPTGRLKLLQAILIAAAKSTKADTVAIAASLIDRIQRAHRKLG